MWLRICKIWEEATWLWPYILAKWFSRISSHTRKYLCINIWWRYVIYIAMKMIWRWCISSAFQASFNIHWKWASRIFEFASFNPPFVCVRIYVYIYRMMGQLQDVAEIVYSLMYMFVYMLRFATIRAVERGFEYMRQAMFIKLYVWHLVYGKVFIPLGVSFGYIIPTYFI